MIDIHVRWDGPFTLQEAMNLRSPSDYGLYQYYGAHHVYGVDTLLYLGMAQKQTFGSRISQHNWHVWTSTNLEIYVGKICSLEQLSVNEWEHHISLAERIILQSHGPCFNSSNLNSIGHKGGDVRVLNWGKRKLLLPEVSISRWEGEYGVGHELSGKMLQQMRMSNEIA